MGEKKSFADIVEARRRLSAGEYKDRYAPLSEANLEGFWVSPPQKTSSSCTGPVLVAHNFLDFKRAKENWDCILMAGGYLPGIPFNRKLNRVLDCADIGRTDIYITQVLHFLPRDNAPKNTPPSLLCRSFCDVTRHEIFGRNVIALGAVAKDMCRMWFDKYNDFELIDCFPHISSPRFGKDEEKKLVKALRKADGR